MTRDPTTVVEPEPVAAAVERPGDEQVVWPPASPPSSQPASDSDNGSLPLLLAFVATVIAIGVFRTWWIPGIVAGLLFMLFMHELGHYLTARASGMKVTEFFLGFGPKIWSFNRGETEYGIKAIPGGAYVRIIGMTNLDEVDPSDESRTYRAQPYWQRMVTICAGSAMHFLMAMIALFVLFGAYSYQGLDGPPWVVDPVVPGTTADLIGVEPGDRIVEFAGEAVPTWDRFSEVVTEVRPGPIEVTVARDGASLVLRGELGALSGDVVGNGFGLVINEDDAGQGWTISQVRAGSAAAAFGFEHGDVVQLAGDMVRPTQLELSHLLLETEGRELEFVVSRAATTAVLSSTVSLDRSVPFRGFFGIGRVYPDQPDATWGESVGRTIDDFGSMVRGNLSALADLPVHVVDLFRSESDDQQQAAPSSSDQGAPPDECSVSGSRLLSVIGIGRIIACSEGVDEVLFLFAGVNVFIGIFNLVPLLPLDGGHAAIATYERAREVVTRKKHRVDAARLVPVTWVVMLILVGVGLWAALQDIFSWPG
jgi:RIP metalloprotease RseP